MEIKDFPTVTPRIEWPTIALAAVIYAMWFALTLFWAHLPFWTLTLAAAWTTAWHMSLQHEIIHGHPTRIRWVNNGVGQWPLALWLPFENYRHSHLDHHNDERLTDPLDDPESYYWRQEDWDGLGRFGRAIIRLQASLLGRLLIGPFWASAKLWKTQFAEMAAGDRTAVRAAIAHVLEMAVVLIWVVAVCRMPLFTYLFCFVYAGTSLAMVRSFAEHRAESVVERRTAIVEKSWILGPLFLFNNLHVAHHMRHTMPWYALPRWYRVNRAALIERNGGLVYDSYFEVIRRYFLRPHDQSLHPRLEAPTVPSPLVVEG
jgi:fatty acid desaturase